MPHWFKTLQKASNSVRCYTDNRGGLMTCTTSNTKSNFSLFAGIAMTDLQSSMAFSTSSNNNSQDSSALANAKIYMYDHQATHIWKNNSNTAAIAEFYILLPRRDLPHFQGDQSDASWSDNALINTHDYNYSNAFQQDGKMYTQWFTDAGLATAETDSTKMQYNDIDATPYLNSTLASMFKIKRLRVKGPKGLSPYQVLAPGEMCSYQSNHIKPRLVNFNKYGLSGLHKFDLPTVYSHLKETPIIFMYLRGGVAHSDTTKTTVVPSAAWLDYVCKKSWKVLIVRADSRATVRLVTPPTIAAEDKLVESNAYGGGQVVAEQHGDV